ncbi:hypothetical protein [Shewanella sp. Arc9-LZ]|uniref:hypothetical protein n=1 Tax=Shewanella sp. Arc9-LZ TaxID=2698686 RepID=UPI00137C029E|nr:hypothetical protein [Shewanella sp. Arc9-LZ]QHS14953.1 hypothetical protein GUY17_18495 [Shewanella sp. Arc9-LZ]
MYKNIEEAMAGLSVWKEHRRVIVRPLSKNLAYKPTFEADYLREAVMYRFIELIESAHALYKVELLVGSVVSVRSAYETLAVMWYLNTKLSHLVKTKDLKHFSERTRSLILGWSKDEEFPEKTNILTCIKSVDKELEGKFGRHYDMLSEYAHPNYSGTFGAYANPNHETLEVTFGKYPRSEKTLKNHIENTIIISVSMLDNLQEGYEKVINEALDVCLDLHRSGKLKEQLVET